ncbi:GNAT family N-acetyltransferase [Peptococcus simiae]|uniref:GNAT family N-acetyltransferase n=1 Tax=Peptococcus simiae TaxID=1643805 RepID=A0ABW9GZQ1_9FIRM
MSETIHFDHNRFYIGDRADQAQAYLDIEPAGDGVVRATHTVVDESMRGQGVAGKLLEALVNHAREEGWQIVPVCSYVQRAFDKDPDQYGDVHHK